MGTVVAFRRPRPRRPGAALPARRPAVKVLAWWSVGAAAAATAAVLSPLRWPARIALILLGAVGAMGAVGCFWLSSPTNWPMIGHAVTAFLGSIALWHGGEAVLKGARALSAYSFERIRKQNAEPRKAA